MKVIKFETSTCTYCKMVSSFLNDKGIEYQNVDVEKSPELAIKFDIGMSVPVTLLIDDEGNVLKQSRGFKPHELEDIIFTLNN